MKDFMMIFIGTSYEELGLSPEQLQERMSRWWDWGNKMEEQGVLKGGNALLDPAKRVSGPDRLVSDGPFVESKELVGGYYIVSASSMDEVVEMAQGFPDYDLGSAVEIREVMNFEET